MNTRPVALCSHPLPCSAFREAADPPADPRLEEMQDAVAQAPADSHLANRSALVRCVKGAAAGATGGFGGALAAGAVTGAVSAAAMHVLPVTPATTLTALLVHNLALGLGVSAALAAGAGATGAGAVKGARAACEARAGDHSTILAMRDAAREGGRFEGAAVGAITGAAAGMVLANPFLAVLGAVAGFGVGKRAGEQVGSVAGNLAAVAAKRGAGQSGSPFHEALRPLSALSDHRQAAPTGANKFTPLIDDDHMAADAMREIAQAEKSIHFETYLLNGPDGKALCDLLIRKKDEGLDVKVILDPFFQSYEARFKGDDPQYQMGRYLRENGVDYLPYPLEKLTGSLTPSEHAKMLVVDDRVAYVGGTNIDDTPNHDVNVKIEGPAAADIRRFFDESWVVAGSPDRNVLGLGRDPEVHSADISFYTTNPARSTVKEAILRNIREARESIHVEMFTLTDTEIVEALKAAHERGVDVRVLLCDNKEIFHLPTYHVPNLPTAIGMHDAGIDVRWYENPRFAQMHSKLAIFDHDRVMVGSANWIHNAFRGIHEYYSEIRDAGLAGQLEAQFADDWEKCGRPVEEPSRGQRVLGGVVDAGKRILF